MRGEVLPLSVWLVIVSFPAAFSGSPLLAKTIVIRPDDSVQSVIDQASNGDVVVLQNGVYHGALNIDKSITLKAANGGEATVTNRHGGSITWIETSPGSRTWFAERITLL